MSQLIERDTIETIVAHRDRALELYADAFEKVKAASDAMAAAESAVGAACGGTSGGHYAEKHAPEVTAFENAVKLPDGPQFARVARRLTDIRVWGALIARTDLDHLMDKEAKDELREQMAYLPEQVDEKTGTVINAAEIAAGLPPVSADVVEATLRGLVENSGTIFRRGIANAFSQLDRRFRSHDGFKVGNRVILSRAFDDWGSWNYHTNLRDTLTDIERVFLVLDGKGPRASYAGIVGMVTEERKGLRGMSGAQSEHEGDYFKVRIFKNGNAHLWFTRKDLVEKVNQCLAEYYGEGLGWGRFEEPEPEITRAVGHAKNLGFYVTPAAVVSRVEDEANLYRRDGDKPWRCLEPSAGTGALVRPMEKAGHNVTAFELDPDRAAELRLTTKAAVHGRDFLNAQPPGVGYERILMNPPFDRGRDVDHVLHAWEFLAPGGRLVAIMAAGVEYRTDRKTTHLRKLIEEHGRIRDLPQGAFLESGTNVNTVLVVLTKKG